MEGKNSADLASGSVGRYGTGQASYAMSRTGGSARLYAEENLSSLPP